ncbi:hypothetical protein CSKR_107724 [Clonorchis sinensis]|uniref:Protein-tyrosine-phosphatase n=1 Tax=Clonorchis sinensis TaxID=79923 RepID=A0A8T1MJ61_CLOSI|nr:hypothetical protein CSKR_107724 [Clonorchis sinensis]
MASGPVASIRWMLLIWLWSHRLWCHAICDWNNVKHVAFSMTPKIECSYLALTKRALIFKWVKTSHGPEYYWLKGNPYLPVNSSQLGPQRIQFSVKQEEVAGFKLCLEAVLPTSQGSASLPVEIKVNSFDDLFQPDRPDSARYDISLNAQLNRDGKSIQNYILSWTPQRRVIQNSTYLVLVYSRTSVIQLEARHPRLSLRNLDSGKPYKFCVIASKDVCQGTEWSCTVRLLPVPERDSSEYSQLLSGEKLTLIGTGSTSVQVSWVVPTYTVHRKPTSINRFYALSVYPIGTTQCEISIFYILAPWIQVHEMTIRNGLIDDIKARHVRRNVCTFKKEERLEPLGNWPDWEQFVELLDERNVPNEFTVTIPHLQPNQRYEVELWPTNHFISVKTFEPEEDCNLRLQRKDTRTNVLSWTVPERVNNLTAMNNLDFQLELRRVNHIQTRSLRDTCYVRHCDLKGPSDPQFSEDPTNLLCERHRIAARTESRDQQFSLSCLLPCAVYDVSLTVVANDSLNPQLFSCRRRLLTAAEGTRPQLSVITLSNNMLLFALKEDRNSNYRTCASIGHTATLLNDKHEVMAQPMIFTLENLAQSWALPLLESPKEVNGLLSYRLMLPIPPTKSSRISLELDTFVASDRRVDPLVISSPMDKSACHLDCVWSLPLSNITLAPTSYQTSGQHMAYVVEFGHHESCNKSSTTHDYITTHCQTAQGFVYSDQTHCPLSGSWGTCSVPQCHEMAPITCIDATYPIYYTTRLQVSWGVPPVQNEFYQEWDTTVESTVYGYVATISKPSLTNQRGSKCIHAQLLYYADNDKLSSSRFVDSLMFSCKRRSTLLFKSTPTAHFTDLAQNTSYELRVTPFNAYGRLGATQKQILTTLAAKPCQPHRVGIKAVESQSLVIYASERTGNECGEGKTALLTYYKPGSRSQTLEFPLQSHTDLRLPDLDSCTEYCALVAYVNAVGRGPDSAEVCSTTKRQNFNGSPSISFKCGGPLSGDAHTDASAKGLKLVACKFSAQTDYTKLCPVHYEMEMSIFNAKTAQTMKFDRSEFIVDRYFQCGLYYQVRVRAVAPDYDALLRNDGSYISPYSQPIGLYTGMSDFRFEDLTIHVEPATNKGDFSYCTSPHLIRGGDTSTRAVESGPDDICFRLIWEIAGETQGLMGFVIQVFGNQLIESNSSRPLGAELSDYYEENNVGPCLRMIWIPCPLCLPGFNFTNARDKVIERLRRMIDHCTQINDFGFPRTVQTRSDGIEERIRITNDLRRMTSTTMAFLLPQSKSVDLLVNVSKLVKGPTSSNTADADRKIRQVRSSLLEQPSYYSGQDNNGFIRFYSVNTFDVVLTTEKPWHVYVASSENNTASLIGLSFGIIFGLVLLMLICLIIIFNNKRKNRLRYLAAHQSDFGIIEMSDEDEALRLDVKTPILPPRLTQFSFRQPDPLLVHEFSGWFDKQMYNNFSSLRDEFKALKMHAAWQEQSKRLTREIGQLPENRLRNKYRNLLPFDHNYVHLKKRWRLVDINPEAISKPDTKIALPENGNNLHETSSKSASLKEADSTTRVQEELGEAQWTPSDYINASLIRGHAPGVSNCLVGENHLPRVYIAAQAPTSHTRTLFWQMIWDCEVKLIILLTKLTEESKEKCAQYWPGPSGNTTVSDDPIEKSKVLTLGHFTVTLLEEINTQIYVTRKFRLTNSTVPSGKPSRRTITQLHMLKWVDYSAPNVDDFGSLLYAYWTERRCCAGTEAPVLIHCSAGIGRTGTFICLDQLCQQVRLYLQPDFQPLGVPATRLKPNDWEEPVYENLNDSNTICSTAKEAENRAIDGSAFPSSKAETPDDASSACRMLTKTSETKSVSRRKIFGLGRRKTQCIDVYKTVLWLRFHRCHMVQSEEQYIFIHRYLAYFIQKMSDYEPIYANI